MGDHARDWCRGSATVLILTSLLCAVPPARAQKTLAARTRSTAALVGQVIAEATHQPLGAAAVVVTGMRGNADIDSARTDSAGRFRIEGLTGSTYRLRIQRLGYAAFDAIILVTPGDTITRVFQLGAPAVALPGVTVTGHAAVERRMMGFERRRAKGWGHFLTRAQLDRDQGEEFSNVLRRLSAALMLAQGGDGHSVYLMNREQQAPKAFTHGPLPCLVQIYIDGVRIYEGGGTNPITDPRLTSTTSTPEAWRAWSSMPPRPPRRSSSGAATRNAARSCSGRAAGRGNGSTVMRQCVSSRRHRRFRLRVAAASSSP